MIIKVSNTEGMEEGSHLFVGDEFRRVEVIAVIDGKHLEVREFTRESLDIYEAENFGSDRALH